MCSASFPPPEGMSSFWRTEPGDLDGHRSTAELPTAVDIAIIGAGYSAAAILTHILATTSCHKAHETLTLALTIEGGHLKPDSYNAISAYASEYGIEAAAEVASFEAANVKAVTDYIQQNKVDCDFVLTTAVDVQLSTGHQRRIKEGYDKLIAVGLETTKDTLSVEEKDAEMMSGVKGAKGCFTYTAGHLWPYKLIHHMFSEAISQGINLQTNTPVLSVSDTQDATGQYTLRTSRGEVRARKVVFATNAYTGSLLPEYKNKIIPYRAVCSRIKTPGPHPLLSNTYALRFSDWNFDYLIPRLDGSIIVGGARDAYIRSVDSWYGNVDDTQVIAEARSYFDGYMQRHFHGWEDSGAYVDDIWTGIMGYSSDRLPRVGPIPGRPGMFIMGGFTGHGMPQIYLCGQAMAKFLLKDASFEETGLPRLFEETQARLEDPRDRVLEFKPQRPVSRADFPLAIICAFSLEADAIEALFDEHWDCHVYSKASGDPNSYSTGRIGHHNVVLAYMPEVGKANGTSVATHCRVSFPHVKLAIVVGICGVIPFTPGPRDAHHEIILGDVIVSQSVVQYDLGRQRPGSFEFKNTNEEALGRPNVEVRSLLSKLKGLRARRAFESDMRSFLTLLQQDLELAAHYPGPGTDRLYEATYPHADKDMSCFKCGCNGKLVPRERLRQEVPEPKVHFGRIASGDTVMKSGEDRDDIARNLGVIAFEMESAGVWDSLPCLVIKGACDYADSHKGKASQNYAAATAAACTKAILRHRADHGRDSAGKINISRFLVPFPPNKDFVGRQNILASLRQELCFENTNEVAALFGLGGAGKTQIALAYAHEAHAQNPDLSVFWVYASNEERMKQSYAIIMQQFEIPHDAGLSDLELVKQWLEAKHHKPWLMIVDNADDLDLFCGTGGLSQYLPTCPQGKLLVTTRNRQIAVRATKGRCSIEIPRMTESEAHDLLGEHLGFLKPDVVDLSTLASKLEYLPLILVQAASFIKENCISISDYLSLLETDNNLIELLDEDFETYGRYPDSLRTVTKTWAISFRQIRRQNKLASDLLSIMSMFNHQHIPEDFVVTYLSLFYGQEKTLERLRAIGLLKAFSFVSSGEDNSFSMHRLIQLVMREWLIREDTIEDFLRMAVLTIDGTSCFTTNSDAYTSSTRVSGNISHLLTPLGIFLNTFGTSMWSRTDTLNLFKDAFRAIYQDLIFLLGYNDLQERALPESLDMKKKRLDTVASAAILESDYHVLWEERSRLIRQLKTIGEKERTFIIRGLENVVHTWRLLLPPGTSNTLEKCEADLRDY
ncbi:gamma-glutamylputrescine oxidoreductase [Fusarium mexicanum]|uniref:Gamma-glutamylputrescine oxidoreductase n=1 Tax=Fusarium mexicanum TaxID=751941 RepID=A0A8H5IJA3_9HYPO|nr:gamma-glutamylputrescine oxidoreductase [Fusarium mexicanum]